MSVVDRIKQIIYKERLSISAFEKKCGLSNNSIQTAIKRNANLKDVTLNSILKSFPLYNPTWLLTGKGEMIMEAIKETTGKESKTQRKVLPAENKNEAHVPDEKLAGENALLKEKVDTLEKQLEKVLEIEANRKTGRRRAIKWYFAAAFLIASAGAIYQSYFQDYSNEALFKTFYKPFNPEYDNSNRFTRAVFSYEKGNYKKAIELFNQSDSLNYPETFYLALSYCGHKEYHKAIKLLSGIKGTESEYIDKAGWYLGLCYLKMSDTEKAIKEFEAITKSPGPYKEKAAVVLKEIRAL